MQTLEEILLGLCFLLPCVTEVVSFETSSKICCKMWICKLWFICGSCMMCSATVSYGRSKSWAMYSWNSWLDKVDQQEGLPISWFKALRFLSVGKYEFYSLYYRSQGCQGLNSECRMDMRWFVWHLEFSSKLGSHCSYVQHPAWKFEGGHFKHNSLIVWRLCFRSPILIYIYMVLWCTYVWPCIFCSSCVMLFFVACYNSVYKHNM
jgi:hypothetical protein